MADTPRRRPRRTPATPPGTPAADVPETTETKKPAAKPVSAWRRRMYRIPVLGTIAYVVWPPRTGKPSVWRRGISSVLAVVALLGVGMAAYPWAGDKYPFFYKVPVEKLIEWSNFLSDMQTNRLQDLLEKQFAACKPLCTKEGQPLTRIEIPRLGVDTIVVQGTSPSALRAGAGHYPSTPLPGQSGNVGIAGHRTTYGRPFARVDQLKVKDRIVLTTPIGRYTYRVSRPPFLTNPYDWSIVAKTKEPLLTLTTCHPKGSARQRLIVRAELTNSAPVRQAA
jgi:LPXTG-site transpeptidase (sortase) family protein